MITLEMFAELINDSLKISIEDYQEPGVEIAAYDGRDSIPKCYNDCNVVYVNPDWERNVLVIELEVLS